MCSRLLCVLSLLLGLCADSFADSDSSRLSADALTISKAEKDLIGRTVCGAGKFETTASGVRCRTCPSFTGDPGSDEGLEIGHIIRGQLTATGTGGEWLLDTDGCEAHYDSYGGALLLDRAALKSVAGAPVLALGSSPAAKPDGGSLGVIFYQPGFRLNDCLTFGGGNARTLLVCNESDMAQGEVIGHISAMEVSHRGITRWRLLRWYDNTGSDMPQIVSVVPTGMRRVELDDRQAGLQIQIRIFKSTRADFDKAPDSPGKTVNLVFKRKGQRFYATVKTQQNLEKIGTLTRNVLE